MHSHPGRGPKVLARADRLLVVVDKWAGEAAGTAVPVVAPLVLLKLNIVGKVVKDGIGSVVGLAGARVGVLGRPGRPSPAAGLGE